MSPSSACPKGPQVTSFPAMLCQTVLSLSRPCAAIWVAVKIIWNCSCQRQHGQWRAHFLRNKALIQYIWLETKKKFGSTWERIKSGTIEKCKKRGVDHWVTRSFLLRTSNVFFNIEHLQLRWTGIRSRCGEHRDENLMSKNRARSGNRGIIISNLPFT